MPRILPNSIKLCLNKRDLSYDNEQYTISIIGYLSTKGGTQKQFDDYLDAICDKLFVLTLTTIYYRK